MEVARFPWGASGRAIAIDRVDGLTKLLIDPETERVLGVGIVGSGAGELIAEGVLAIEMGATACAIARAARRGAQEHEAGHCGQVLACVRNSLVMSRDIRELRVRRMRIFARYESVRCVARAEWLVVKSSAADTIATVIHLRQRHRAWRHRDEDAGDDNGANVARDQPGAIEASRHPGIRLHSTATAARCSETAAIAPRRRQP